MYRVIFRLFTNQVRITNCCIIFFVIDRCFASCESMKYEFHKTLEIHVKFHEIYWIFFWKVFFIGIDFKHFLVILFHRSTFHWDAFIRSAYSRDAKLYPNIVLLMFSKQSILCYEKTWICSKLDPPVRIHLILACYQILTYLSERLKWVLFTYHIHSNKDIWIIYFQIPKLTETSNSIDFGIAYVELRSFKKFIGVLWEYILFPNALKACNSRSTLNEHIESNMQGYLKM